MKPLQRCPGCASNISEDDLADWACCVCGAKFPRDRAVQLYMDEDGEAMDLRCAGEIVEPSEPPEHRASGMTKREMIAAMAMQGLLSMDGISSTHPADVAKWAVEQADALLAALEGGEVQP